MLRRELYEKAEAIRQQTECAVFTAPEIRLSVGVPARTIRIRKGGTYVDALIPVDTDWIELGTDNQDYYLVIGREQTVQFVSVDWYFPEAHVRLVEDNVPEWCIEKAGEILEGLETTV